MDGLSSLPDEIICHTLSFITTKEAVTTSILSKRWRYLFALTQNLCFEDEDFHYYNNASFICFLDRVLSISANSTLLKKFALKYRYMVEPDILNRWICKAVSRGTLNHLHIDVKSKDRINKVLIILPLEIFTCKTLVTLRLGEAFVIPVVPEGASFPALKSIFLDRIRLSDQTFEALLSACHVLEDLQIYNTRFEDIESCHTVSCKTLQRLTIVGIYVGHASICFDTPSLAYLKYSGCAAREYRIVNLDSLIEANIHFATPIVDGCDPTNLIKGLRNVKILKLETSENLYFFREAIPVLEKLSHLSIGSGGYKFWRLLPVLLKKSPNLETLFIEYFYLGCIDNSICECVFSCPVKVVEIAKFSGTVQQIAQIKHLLKKLPCLELLKVRAWTQPATDLSFFPFEKEPATDLSVMTLQRITQNRKIRLEINSS